MRELSQRCRRSRFESVGLLCVCAAVATVLLPASGQARAMHVSCGATITSDTTLKTDLASCPNNGIVIGADNITLDLNAHTVSGDGEPVASCPAGASCDIGIDNSAGHTGVTIRGGAVRGFDVGALVLGASENRLHRLASANNSSFGLIVGDSTETRVDHNSSDHGVAGIVMRNSRDSHIDHNWVAGTGGYAIAVHGSSHIRFDQNTLEGDKHGILCDRCEDSAFRGNRIFRSGGGIEVDHSDHNLVSDNVMRDGGDGVGLIGTRRTVVTDNTVTRMGFAFPDSGGVGVLLDGGDHNVVQRNALSGGSGPAIFVTQLEEPDAPDHNVIAHNVANSKLSDGILVGAGATATLLERNTANGNGDDGIDVDAADTTVTHNTANDNRDLGIEAVPGVIDGGGNRASGNGDALQCRNLTCF